MAHEERPNWVEARANCTLEDTFKQLTEAIRQDIKCFNKLPPYKREGRGEITYRKHDANHVYVGYAESERLMVSEHVCIRMTASDMEVRSHEQSLLTVEREWNPKTLTCDLLIEGEIHSLWQISQKAIGDLLFQ